MIVEQSVHIATSKEKVWTVISDIEHLAEIITGVERIEILQTGTNLLGLRWRETRMYFGSSASIEKEIIELRQTEVIVSRSAMDGFEFITRFEIEAVNSGCRLLSSHQTIARSVAAKIKSIPMIFFKGMMKKAIMQDLNDIKARSEAG
jgi:uncharacterized membrane protein